MFKKTLIASAILAATGAAYAETSPLPVTGNMTAIVNPSNPMLPGPGSEPRNPPMAKFALNSDVTINNTNPLTGQPLPYIALDADVDLGSHQLTLNFNKAELSVGPVWNVYFHGTDSSVLTMNNLAASNSKGGSVLGSWYGTFDNAPTIIEVGTLNLTTKNPQGCIYMSDKGAMSITAHTINIDNQDESGVGILTAGNSELSIDGVKSLFINAGKVGVQVNGNQTATEISAAGTGASITVNASIHALAVINQINAGYATKFVIDNSLGSNTFTSSENDVITVGAYKGTQNFGVGAAELTIVGATNQINGSVNVGRADSALYLSGESTITGNVAVLGTLGVKGSVSLGGEVNVIKTLAPVPQTSTVRTFALRATAPAAAPEAVTLTITNPNSRTTIEENRTALTVEATGDVNDAAGGIDGFVGTNGMFSIGASTAGGSARVTMAEGLVEGAVTAELNNDGSVNASTVVEKVNSVQEATLNLTAALPITVSRALTNDVRKRLGDIRSAEGTHGVWARYDGGKMSAGSDFDHKFHTIQVGVDTEPRPDSVRFGVAFSYTTGDTDFARGSSDMDAFSLAAYGTWLGDNGLFADVIGRIATVKNDMTVEQYKGKTDNTVLALSGEFGWRWDATDLIYVEPAAELTYTYIDGDKFKLGYADYETDSVDSLVGRAGFALGIKCPNKKGDAYVRVAAVHEFLGDSKVTARGGSSINTAEFDGKDTWVEYAVGASYNITPNTYLWADIERTSGAEVDENIRGTVGIRYSF